MNSSLQQFAASALVCRLPELAPYRFTEHAISNPIPGPQPCSWYFRAKNPDVFASVRWNPENLEEVYVNLIPNVYAVVFVECDMPIAEVRVALNHYGDGDTRWQLQSGLTYPGEPSEHIIDIVSRLEALGFGDFVRRTNAGARLCVVLKTPKGSNYAWTLPPAIVGRLFQLGIGLNVQEKSTKGIVTQY